jgi:hypothetical protein
VSLRNIAPSQAQVTPEFEPLNVLASIVKATPMELGIARHQETIAPERASRRVRIS